MNEDMVICTQVRSVDPPQFIAEDLADLHDRFPGEWGGEQCDACGCCAYTVERIPGVEYDDTILNRRLGSEVLVWQVRCSGDPDLARQYAEDGAGKEQVLAVQQGCGATYRLMWKHENEVAF